MSYYFPPQFLDFDLFGYRASHQLKQLLPLSVLLLNNILRHFHTLGGNLFGNGASLISFSAMQALLKVTVFGINKLTETKTADLSQLAAASFLKLPDHIPTGVNKLCQIVR